LEGGLKEKKNLGGGERTNTGRSLSKKKSLSPAAPWSWYSSYSGCDSPGETKKKRDKGKTTGVVPGKREKPCKAANPNAAEGEEERDYREKQKGDLKEKKCRRDAREKEGPLFLAEGVFVCRGRKAKGKNLEKKGGTGGKIKFGQKPTRGKKKKTSNPRHWVHGPVLRIRRLRR